MPTVLYDGECGLCRFIMGSLLRWDRRRRLRPLALQTAEGIGLLPDMDEETRLASFHFVEPDGSVHSGGRALPRLLRCLPGGAPLASAMEAVQPLTDRLYDLIAHNRDKIGPHIPERWKQSATRVIESRA